MNIILERMENYNFLEIIPFTSKAVINQINSNLDPRKVNSSGHYKNAKAVTQKFKVARLKHFFIIWKVVEVLLKPEKASIIFEYT